MVDYSIILHYSIITAIVTIAITIQTQPSHIKTCNGTMMISSCTNYATAHFLILALLYSASYLVSPSYADCSAEFENCVMSRDCCSRDLTCVTGDWAVTTDSTCKSSRSIALDALSRDERIDLLVRFYQPPFDVSTNENDEGDDVPQQKKPKTHPPYKSREQVQRLVEKYSNSFSQLVARIEKRYNRAISKTDSLGEEL